MKLLLLPIGPRTLELQGLIDVLVLEMAEEGGLMLFNNYCTGSEAEMSFVAHGLYADPAGAG